MSNQRRDPIDRVPQGGVVGSHHREAECPSRSTFARPPHPAWDAINRVPTSVEASHRAAIILRTLLNYALVDTEPFTYVQLS